MNRICLPDAAGQGIPLVKCDIYLKARWPRGFVLQSLGPGTSRNET